MPKNILFVINTLGLAGAETALLELLERFKPPEYQVELYVLLGQGELVERLPEHVKLLNTRFSKESVHSAKGRKIMTMTVIRAMLRRGVIFRKLPYLIGNMADMVKRHRFQTDKLLWRVLSDGGDYPQKEYDLAVAFIEGGAAYYVADHVKAKKKAVFLHIDYELSGYTRKLDQSCYLKYDRVFPISEETVKSFLEVYPECKDKTYVFHNIVNQKKIRVKAEQPGGFADAFDGTRILTVARLNKQKSFPIAIEAMEKLKKEGMNVRWYVLGEGDERKNLEQLIEEKGLQKDFLLLGAVENPFPYYKQTDLYVHATAYEGKSIAIQEAQTLACSIIVSDIISNRQQVADGEDGVVCKLDAECLKNAITDLIRNPQKAKLLGEKAAKRKMAYEKDLQKILELLEA